MQQIHPRKAAAAVSLFSAIFLSAILIASSAFAQAPQPETPAMRSRVDAIIGKMTLQQKLEYIGGTGFAIRAMPSLGLPAFEMSDGPFGTRSNVGFPSTTYAAGIGLAASWDRDLARRVGGGIGRDARARGVHYMLGPGVDIYRSPRNGRNFEYFGEDPFLAANIAVGYIEGMQAQGVSATIKHFMGNNSEFLRHDSDSIISERAAREIYLPTFEAAVRKADVGAIMDSYNLTNGLHMTQNGYFNTDIARKEWGFKGVMMSDWVATYDAVAAANGGLDLEMPTGAFMNPKNLTAAVQSGKVSMATIDEKVRHILMTAARFGWLDRNQTDLSIPAYDPANNAVALDSARESIVLLKNEGKLLPLDKAQIKSILVVGPDAYPGVPVGGGSAGVKPFHTVSDLEAMSAFLGSSATVYYDRGLPTLAELVKATHFTTEAHNGQSGLKSESFTDTSLNEKQHDATRWTGYYTAAQAGRYIIAMQAGGEGRHSRVSIDDKPVLDNWKIVRSIQPHTTLQLSAGPHKIEIEQLGHRQLGRLQNDNGPQLAIVEESKIVNTKAKELAAKADAVLVAVGFDHDSESEGGDRTFDLPFGQDQLIRAMTAANKKSIVAVTSGGNVDSESWIAQTPAYIENWYGGQDGGTALTEALFGAVNPSGHLPATFERRAQDNPTFNNYYSEGPGNRIDYKEGIFVGYRGYEHNHIKPLFPFGYGLSYTTFKFSNLSVSPTSATSSPNVTVTFDVTNTGSRAGADVAQVYVSDTHSSVPRPVKELKGFDRVSLQPGETKHVSVALDARSFAYYDTQAKKWHITPGRFGVLVGDSSESLPLKGSVEVSKQAADSASF
ncbi:MAG TPA: glycoside hydrolase family 3 C-terminal domain-containing protein [Edaphobacter sp.]|nr:glycoside hydrolase family 3 C-terminal domain-containing protein [Edaphobacter sp.]